MKRLWLLPVLLSAFTLPLPAADAPQDAPAFSLKDLSGTAWTQAGPPQGVLLLDFWAGWCAPCVEEIPSLNALQARYGPGGRLAVLGVCMDKGGLAGAKASAAKHHLAYAVVPGDAALAKAFSVSGFPTAFVVKHGKILDTLTGKHSQAEFEKELSPYLK
ncbi:MAG TPA: TlpA disulfide reductase family protein [bacterium]|jgi:thiol-disulfide isomerase/thioredoxin|nr:TlpA disulfide reductase family protein [bacterium]